MANLTLGSQTYTKAELLVILGTPPRGDASLILAHQLIAADLNIANGSDPAPVSGDIFGANFLLSGFFGKLPYNVSPSSISNGGPSMVGESMRLDSYNSSRRPNCTQ